VSIDDLVYIGEQKVNEDSSFFMNKSMGKECISSLKPKNSEGFDHKSQRIVVDGIEYIFYLLICLLKLIYKEKKSP
jgi:hypothetical protein